MRALDQEHIAAANRLLVVDVDLSVREVFDLNLPQALSERLRNGLCERWIRSPCEELDRL